MTIMAGMNLSEYLRTKDLKPSAFAADLGVSPSTITRILRGERSPGFNLIMRIEAATKGKVKPVDWYEVRLSEAAQ